MSIENNLKKIADNLEGIYSILRAQHGEAPPALAEKPKRGRPPLEKEKEPETKPEPETKATKKKEPEKKEPEVTSEEVYSLAVVATKEKKIDVKVITDILSVFGVKTINEIPEDKLPEAKKFIEDAIAEVDDKEADAPNPF